MNSDSISVVIPLYNAEKTLEVCVSSVLNQSLQPAEILLVDDGSVDGTLEVAEKLCEQFSNVHILRQNHGGTSAARNFGLREAKSEWILFLDADDQLVEGALLSLTENLNETVDACCGRILRGNERKKQSKRSPVWLLDTSALLNRALANPTDLLTIHGWIFRRSVYADQSIFFNPVLRMGEDSDWLLRYLTACQGAVLIPAWVYRYSISPDSSIHCWKPGQTQAYLDMLDTIGKTSISQEKNWPVFTLTTLLLILTHDTFHPANPASRKEQFQEINRLRTLPVMEKAFRQAELSKLDFGKRITLIWLKARQYLPVWGAIKFRQWQNAQKSKER